jgi:hypothetical protein
MALPVVALLVVVLPIVALLVVVLLDTATMVLSALALLRESPWYIYCYHHL